MIKKISENPFQYMATALFGMALIAFITAYYPSRIITLRVEHWNFNHFYAQESFNLFTLKDLGKVAFWTPFADFRMIPLAYLWLYGTFKLFGNTMSLYWLLSIVLHLGNCLLLAKFVSYMRGSTGVKHGLIAAALFALLPAKFETIIWTFFSYKLFSVTLILLSLITLEKALRMQRRTFLSLSLFLLFLSCLFYEAALPLAVVYLIRVFMARKDFRDSSVYFFVFAVGIFYLVYFCLQGVSRVFIPSLFGKDIFPDGMYIDEIKLLGVLPIIIPALGRWIFYGLILGNSGLRFKFEIPGSLTFEASDNLPMIVIAVAMWLSLFLSFKYTQAHKETAFYMLFLVAAGSLLILIGRISTGGSRYLSGMSIYQYYPSLFIAGILGYLAQETIESKFVRYRRRITTTGILCLLIGFLGFSNFCIVKLYMHHNHQVRDFIGKIGKAISADPDIKISPRNIKLPFTPTHKISYAEHAYEILHLLYGENIVKPDEMRKLQAIKDRLDVLR